MNLDYLLLKDLSEKLKQQTRLLLRQIILNEGKIYIRVSHLLKELEDVSRSMRQEVTQSTHLERALDEASDFVKKFVFFERNKNQETPDLANPNLTFRSAISWSKTDLIEVPGNALMPLIYENQVEIKEFGSLLEEDGHNSAEILKQFPYSRCRITIDHLIIKSHEPITLLSKEPTEEDLCANNLHRWFIIKLLWEDDQRELESKMAWEKFSKKFCPDCWHPVEETFFKLKNNNGEKLIVMEKHKDDNIAEEFFKELRDKSYSDTKNSDMFRLRKATFRKYFNTTKKIRNDGYHPPKKIK